MSVCGFFFKGMSRDLFAAGEAVFLIGLTMLDAVMTVRRDKTRERNGGDVGG